MALGLSKAIIWLVAAFYAYGALVHMANMASLSGFDWMRAPLKWQVLDVVYLIIDLTVVVGLVMAWRIGAIAFYAAALSQIILYTVFRAWIVDVPEEFAPTPEQIEYLNGLVGFHVVTIVLMTGALWWRSQTTAAA